MSIAIMVPPGLNAPEPVAPFLNGKFPTTLSTSIQTSELFTQSSFSGILVFTAEPLSTQIHLIQRGGQFL